MSNESRFRDLAKQMAVDLRRARQHLDEVEEAAHEPIAVLGAGCRYPGGVASPEDLWDLLVEEREGLGEFPTDRGWDLERLFDPNPDGEGRSYVDRGGFLYDAALFDADFFGISPREASAMEPQQRLVLETAWEAIERAGIDPVSLHGSDTGMFLGLVAQPYGPRVHEASDGLDAYLITGVMPAVAAGRVSYILGLEGPAVTVDTACSSSLTATHMAIRSLRAGESSLALVGGSTVYADTGGWVTYSRQRALSPDGRCKAFGEGADGTSWSEGTGMVVLERLSDARRNGRRILGVIRGSAVNQDGASSGFTAPNGTAQRRVIRDALADARLTPTDVDLMEAHGTGTRLGDPIEAQALLDVYGQGRPDNHPLWLGSLKSNIGHTAAAAGVGGLLKTLMALRHGTMPRTLHADTPTTQVDWTTGNVRLLSESRPWPELDRPRRAAVSSFGVSGSNAHVVLEQAPTTEDGGTETQPVTLNGARPTPAEATPVAWPVSGRTPQALADQAARLRDHVTAEADLSPTDLAWSLATTRTHHAHRAAVVGTDRATLLGGLDALAHGVPTDERIVRGHATGRVHPVFVYPGQGGQWPGMAEALLDSSPVFAARIADCAHALDPFIDWSLEEVLRRGPDAPPLERVDVIQPALWAVMVSLTEVWRAHGVEPAAVLGHSQGEIAAAYVAGILTLEDAARVVALRARAVRVLSGTGAMASVALPEEQVREHLGDGMYVAAVNSPAATVVAGNPEGVRTLVERYQEQGVHARLIPAGYASHTPHVAQLRERILTDLASVRPRKGEVPFYSSLLGAPLGDIPADAEYWYRSLREPVAFHDAARALADRGETAFLEVSPHPIMSVPLRDTLDAAGTSGIVLATLRRDDGGPEAVVRALAHAHTHGVDIDWASLFPRTTPRAVELPTYAFQGEHHWVTQDSPRTTADPASAGLDPTGHPMLGAVLGRADDDSFVHTGRVDLRSHPWLADHVVLGEVLLPGTAFLETALHAGEHAGCPHVQELVLQAPLGIPEDGAVRIQVSVDAPDTHGRREVRIHSRTDTGEEDRLTRPWTLHASGTLSTTGTSGNELRAWPPPGADPVPIEDFYTRLVKLGNDFGPAFRAMKAAWSDGQDLYAEVALPDRYTDDAGHYCVHPALMDGSQHLIAIEEVTGGTSGSVAESVGLPFAWSGVSVHAVGAPAVRVRMRDLGADGVAIDLADAAGAPVATVSSLVTRPISPDQLSEATRGQRDDLFRVVWHPVPTARPARPGSWAVLGATGDAAALTTDPVTVGAHPDHTTLLEALDAGAPRPAAVVVPFLSDGESATVEGAYHSTHRATALLQQWLADPRSEGLPLVVLTRGTAAVVAGDTVPDLDHSPLWGLLRTAQMEFPDRFHIVDTDTLDGVFDRLDEVLAGDEPQVALRAGTPHAPRLERVPHPDGPPRLTGAEGHGTVLVTGANGTVGGEVTRHLVARHGVRHLLLVSRKGRDEAGAVLEAELTAQGSTVTFAACDAGDRDALAEVIASVPAEHPLTAVVHSAGTIDSGILPSLTPAMIDHVMRPKVDASLNLHELTQHLDLDAFVLFSSAASTLGNPGQANYAAANAHLDALAERRRVAGLPATTVSWGMWETRSRLTADLGEADLHRYRRMGLSGPFTTEHGLELFDAAITSGVPHLLGAALDLPGTAERAARDGELAPMLRALVRVPRARAASTAPVEALSLAGLGPDERHDALLTLVRTAAAEVLGHPSADTVDPDRPFLEMGFDSLTAVELRNRLNAATDLRLVAGLVFQHTTPTAVAHHLDEQLPEDHGAGIAAAPASTPRTADDGLVTVFDQCMRRDRTHEALRLVEAAAHARPSFTGPDDLGAPRTPVRLSKEATDAPVLVCLPSVLMISGPQEYARLAAALRGVHDVEVLTHPGFAPGEPVPDSVEAVVRAHAELTVRDRGDRPFVLVSRSSGSWVAHALAEHLEKEGTPPAGLVLLDPPHPTDEALLPAIETAVAVMERSRELGIVDAPRLTAMGRYMSLFQHRTPGPLTTPTAVLRPEEPLTLHGHPLAPFTWTPEHTALATPGDHFTLLEEHADTTGGVLHDWLTGQGL